MAYHADTQTTLARYAEAWSTPDADARWALVHACCAPGVTLLAPVLDRPVEGQAAVAAFLGMPRETDAPFELSTHDGHHGWVRVLWRRGEAQGLLVARLDDEERLVEIVHFDD